MSLAFYILAVLTLGAGLGAICFRNLIHCACSLALCLAGLAALYLQLGAQFVGFVQILVYIGAVAVLVVFAILLTPRRNAAEPSRSRQWIAGALAALLALGTLISSIVATTLPMPAVVKTEAVGITVAEIGASLMTRYVIPLEVIALLLTAALVGAVIVAMEDPPSPRLRRAGLGPHSDPLPKGEGMEKVVLPKKEGREGEE